MFTVYRDVAFHKDFQKVMGFAVLHYIRISCFVPAIF